MEAQSNDPRIGKSSFRAKASSHLGPLLLWTVLWGLFFLTILLGQERLPSSDFSGQYHAFGVFQAQEMSQGRLPLWSPGSYGGFPFAADTQASTFYPLRWLTILLSLPWGFTFYALEAEAIFHLWLAGLFTYALTCHMTRNQLAALVSAIAFGLGGYLTSFPLLQVTILETFSWLPLVLLLLRLGVGDKVGRSLRFLIGAGLILGISFLAGHPQAFLYNAYLTVAYFLFLAFRANWNWRSIVGFGGVVGGVTVGIAAISWLPAAHLTTYATRNDVSYDFISGGLPLLDYLQFLVPGSFSFWVPQYVGLTPFILALFAIFGRKYLKKGKGEVVFWTAVALVTGWLALGDAGVLFQLAYRVAPGFSLFRQQERLLALVTLALALLAGQGAALWFHVEAEIRRRLLLKTGAVVIAGLGFAAVILLAGSNFFHSDWSIIWIRQAALLIPIFFFLGNRQNQQRHMLLLILFLGLDLYAATYEGLDRQTGSPQVYWPEPDWLEDFQAELAQQPLSRIDSRNLFHANIGPIHGLEDMHGISPLKLAWLADFERLPQTRRMELMGVSHILAYDQPQTPSVLVGQINEGLIPERPLEANIYQVEKTLPRAWMTYQAQTVENEDAAWTALTDPAFDPGAVTVLHSAAPQLETISQPDTPPIVETIRPSANSLEISVETAAPGLLVISEWRYPGWQATLDGKPVDLYPADYALQAVVVPAGSHTVQLRFQPLDVIVGGLASILTLLASAVFVFGNRPRWLPQAMPTNRKRILIPALPDIRARLPAFQLSSKPLVILIPLFLIAFLLRAYNLGLQELRAEEAISHSLTTMPFTLSGLLNVANPLQFLLLNIWVNLAGDSEFAMRYLALLPAVLAIPLLFVLGRLLAGTKVGLLLILFSSSSQSLVWLSQDVQSHYMWAIFFLLLATHLLIEVVKRPSWNKWLLYILACSLAFYSHPFSLFAILAHGLYFVVVPAHRPQFRRWITAEIISILLFLPLLLYLINDILNGTGPPIAQELADYLTTVGQALTVGPAFDRPIGVWLFLGLVFVAVFGWRQMWLRQRGWAAMLGGWLGAMVLGIFVVSFRQPTFNAFTIALAAPAWWLLVSLGLYSLWKKRDSWGQWVAIISVVTLIGASGFSLSNYYSDPILYGRSTGLRPLSAHIAAQWQPNDIVIANSPNPSLAYYLQDVPGIQILEPSLQQLEQQALEEALGQLSESVKRVWFLRENDNALDAEIIAFSWLDYHTMIEQSLTFGDERLFAFRPSHAVDRVMMPIGAKLGEELALAGYYVTLNGRPLNDIETISIQPDDALAVTLIWDSLATTLADYTVFVHLLGEDGSLIAQHDGTPLFGTRPTSTWQPGERLLDRHVIQISDEMVAGNGRLVAGIYLVNETGTVVRQLFNGDEEAIWLK